MKRILYIGNQLSNKQITITTIDSLSKNLQVEGFEVKTVSKKSNKVLRILDMASSVFRYKNSVDYVLIDTYSTLNFYYALIISQLCKFFRLDYIPILHGGNLPTRLKNNPRLSRLIFSKSFVNVSPSKYLEKSFRDFGYDNVRYIPNSIDFEKYPFIPKEKDKIKLLWVRSLAKIYNPKMAIEVLRKLKEGGYDAELCMVGPDKESLRSDLEILSHKYDVKVKFTGKLSKSEWVQLSKTYNLFINTTYFDNMPVSVIEAMALGFPVISTNVGGLPFLIDNGIDGFLVNENDVDQMVQKIVDVIENTELFEIISKNARKKAKNFDWNATKQQWIELLI